MGHVKSIIFLISIVISSQNLIRDPKNLWSIPDQESLAESIIGRWQILSTQGTLHQLEFIDSDTLIYNRITSDSVELYNVVFHYSFDGENQISIQGRYRDELQITRDETYLLISPKGSLIPYGRYKRVTTIQWPIFGISIGIVSFLIMSRSLIAIRKNRLKEFSHPNWRQSKAHWLDYLLQFIVAILVFGIGLLIGRNIWTDWRYFLILIGWDALIMLELSLTIAVIAIRIIYTSWMKIGTIQLSTDSLLKNAGIVLLGFSVYGAVYGTIQIIIFILFGSYL